MGAIPLLPLQPLPLPGASSALGKACPAWPSTILPPKTPCGARSASAAGNPDLQVAEGTQPSSDTARAADVPEGHPDSPAGFCVQGEVPDESLGSSEELEGFVRAALRIL